MSEPDDAARALRHFLTAVKTWRMLHAGAMMVRDCAMQDLPRAYSMSGRDIVMRRTAPRCGATAYCLAMLSEEWPDSMPVADIHFADRFEQTGGWTSIQSDGNGIAETQGYARAAR